MLGLLIRDKLNLEHFCGAPFVLSSCGHCCKEGEHPKVYHHIDTDYDVYDGYNNLQSQHMFGTYLVMGQNPGTLATRK